MIPIRLKTWSSSRIARPTSLWRRSCRLAAAAILTAALAAASALAQAPATPVTPQDEATRAAITLDAAKSRLAHAQQEFDIIQQRYRSGAVTASEVGTARAQLDQAEADLRLAAAADLPARRRDLFYRPVDVALHDATLPQAADVLSKYAGFPVVIAKDVPQDIRVSLQASGVPFGTVLEAVAREAKLMIAPDHTGGVLLRPWPIMVVNGDKTQRYVGPNAPWSDEWGAPSGLPFPGMDQMPRWQLLPGIVGQAGNPAVQPGAAGSQPGQPSFPPGAGREFFAQGPPNAALPFQYMPPGMDVLAPRPGPPIALSQLGQNMIVLAEPGVGGQGEPGVWLTVYLYDAREGRLVRRGSTFHPFQSQGPRPAAGRPYYLPPTPAGANPFGNVPVVPPPANPTGRPNDAVPGGLRPAAPPRAAPDVAPGKPADPARPAPVPAGAR